MEAAPFTGLDKGLSAVAVGLTPTQFLATGPRLSDLSTPVAVLDDAALDANVAQMAAWCAARGVALAPHGKTTMAPALWQRQLDAGAWGITVATPGQVAVAVAAGVPRILLANPLVDPTALRWAVRTLDERPGIALTVWADSVAAVAAMDEALGPEPRRRLPSWWSWAHRAPEPAPAPFRRGWRWPRPWRRART